MIDQVNVKGKSWEFNGEVAECFNDMLSRSIPDYNDMRRLTLEVGTNYVQRGTYIVDIGCSTGGSVAPFLNRFGAYNKYKLYDVSKPMLKKCHDRFSCYEKAGILEVSETDIKEGVPQVPSSLVISSLTLQFTPIEYRQKIVQSIYDSLLPGGCLLLIEKVLGYNAAINDTLVKEYYRIKQENAYTQEQISDKRKSLEGVLVPITAQWNEELLRSCGFTEIDCYWRYLNFAAWVAVKR